MRTNAERAALVAGVEGFIGRQARRIVVPVLGYSHWDDAVQEGRLVAWRSSASYDPAKCSTFLRYASRFIVGGMVKYADRWLAFRRAETNDGDEAADVSVDHREPDPAAAAELADTGRAVRDAIDRMPHPRRVEVIRLRFGIGESRPRTIAESSRIVGVSLVTCWKDEKAALADLGPVLESLA